MKITPAAFLFLVVLLLCVVWAFIARRGIGPAPQPAQTPSGQFELLGVTRRGEPFRKGSPLERLLDDSIPFNGFSAGGHQLRRPEKFGPWEDAPLTAWLLYRGSNLSPRIMPLFGAGVVTENSTGRQIENPLPSTRQARPNELLISVPIFAFPRDEDQFRLRFSPPVTNEAAREWITFKIDNPFGGKRADCPPEAWPKTNVIDGETVVLRSMTIGPVSCEFDLPGAGWTVPRCSITDPEGNAFQASRAWWNTNTLGRGFAYTLETNQPWRIDATFVRATNFATSDLRTLRFTANAETWSVTNRTGQIFVCTLRDRLFQIAGEPGNGPPYWLVSGATNMDNGKPLKFFADAVWQGVTGGTITKIWPLEEDCTNAVFQIADPKVLSGQWCVDPSRASRGRNWYPDTMARPRLPAPSR